MLNTAFNNALKAPDVVEIARNEGQSLLGTTPAEFSTFLKVETKRYRDLVRSAGISIQ